MMPPPKIPDPHTRPDLSRLMFLRSGPRSSTTMVFGHVEDRPELRRVGFHRDGSIFFVHVFALN